jgi:hypothetical protein
MRGVVVHRTSQPPINAADTMAYPVGAFIWYASYFIQREIRAFHELIRPPERCLLLSAFKQETNIRSSSNP